MQTIPLAQLQEMFASLRTETGASIDGEMLWGYYFTADEAAALEPLSQKLEGHGFEVSDIFKSEDEPIHILQAQRLEAHTPESLFALNAELEAVAKHFAGVEYDGMDVNPAEGGCCGGNCHCEEEESGEEHGCCGGHGHAKSEEERGCCGGHGHHHAEAGEEHECCGGGGGGGCCGRHVHNEGQPIENPQILAAAERLATDRSEAAQQQMTLALQRGLFLVPVFSGRLDTEPADDESLQVLVCTDENNDEFLPLFTDEGALKSWTAEKVSAMVLTAPEAWEFILSQPECAGGVINPGGASLPLNREMVGLLKKMIDDHERNIAG